MTCSSWRAFFSWKGKEMLFIFFWLERKKNCYPKLPLTVVGMMASANPEIIEINSSIWAKESNTHTLTPILSHTHTTGDGKSILLKAFRCFDVDVDQKGDRQSNTVRRWQHLKMFILFCHFLEFTFSHFPNQT